VSDSPLGPKAGSKCDKCGQLFTGQAHDHDKNCPGRRKRAAPPPKAGKKSGGSTPAVAIVGKERKDE